MTDEANTPAPEIQGQADPSTPSSETGATSPGAAPSTLTPEQAKAEMEALDANSTTIPVALVIPPESPLAQAQTPGEPSAAGAGTAPSTTPTATPATTIGGSAAHLRTVLNSHLNTLPRDSEGARIIGIFMDSLKEIEHFIDVHIIKKL
jgi:hypothetical protein